MGPTRATGPERTDRKSALHSPWPHRWPPRSIQRGSIVRKESGGLTVLLARLVQVEMRPAAAHRTYKPPLRNASAWRPWDVPQAQVLPKRRHDSPCKDGKQECCQWSHGQCSHVSDVSSNPNFSSNAASSSALQLRWSRNQSCGENNARWRDMGEETASMVGRCTSYQFSTQ